MIRFPQKHMADSVVERIMLAAQKMGKVEAQGAQLDAMLQQPVGDVAPIEGIEEAITAKALDI